MMDAKTGMDPLALANAISGAYIAKAANLPPPFLYTPSAFTISAGDTFNFPTTVTNYGAAEYGGDFRIQLARTGDYLLRLDHNEMDALRCGQPTVLRSVPEYYETWQDRSQVIRGRVYPGAAQAESCNLFTAMIPDDLRDFTNTDLDTVTVDLGRYGIQGLEAYVCAGILAAMTPAKAESLGLDKGVVPLWLKEADDCLYEEAVTRHEIEDAGRTQRWVG